MNKNKLIYLTQEIKNKNIKNIYFFYGNENYLINIYLNRIKKSLLIDLDNQFNYLKLNNMEINNDVINNFINTIPIFSQKKILLIYDDFILNNYIVEKLKNIPKYIHVICISKNKTSFNLLRKEKIINVDNTYFFDLLDNNDLYIWIKKRFNNNNIIIDIKTYKYFIFCCKNSMYNLEHEINKIISYMSYVNISNLTENIIDNICNKILTAKIFEIIDPIINKNYIISFNLIREFKHFGYDYIDIFYVIFNHFKKLYIVKLNFNQKNIDLMKLINTKSVYYLNNMKKYSENLSTMIIINILNFLITKEIFFKKTNNKKILIENIIITIINYLKK